ncbi:uncharacterized protein HMPREF1541_07660 [Cyphellophora europaea CBS 101466]|uniref:Uncharacterized protein n=1 Tax=Cyphellophora europaea (strain CBS 101466) TaxID=1220924 RepID=W2RNJ5_CYPE1|nr:uncharacterized protein HMPREF1541_07660 [Cyphellophora europaea CBS 101466]ETN38037.1 hypothetical protein HMPREF1541_07660 [Cyphellophora europaea CBS 101466]
MERALAVIRAIEAREAEERQRREQEQEAARREEEEQLALLEQERQQDERRRRQEAEALERELRETLELSIRLENENLVQALTDTIHHQHVSLDDHQGQQEQTLVSSYKDFKTEHASRETKLAANIATALEKKLAIINATHDAALQKLAMEHEAQEDDLFMQIQVHLRGKPNKEAREQRMQEELLRQHRTEEASLEEALDRDVKEARDSADQETELLRRAMIIKLERARTQFHHDMARLVAKVAAERKWFFVVSERRVLMATEHTRIVYEELKKGVEPVGLSEDMASAIQPLPSLQVLPTELESYSSLQHTPVELEAPSSFSSDNRGPPSSGSSYTTTSNYSFVSVEECKADNTTTPATPAVSIPIIRRPMPRNPTPPSPSFPRNGPAFVATKPGESSKPVKFTHIPDVARPPTPPDTPYQRSPLMPSRWPLPEASPYTTNPRTLPPPLAAAQPYAPTTKPTRSAAPEPHAWSYYNPLPPSKSKTQDKGKTKDKAKKIETPIPPSQAWNVTPSISSDGSSSLSLASGPEAKARKASRWPFRSKKLTDEEIKDRLRNLKIGDAL